MSKYIYYLDQLITLEKLAIRSVSSDVVESFF